MELGMEQELHKEPGMVLGKVVHKKQPVEGKGLHKGQVRIEVHRFALDDRQVEERIWAHN